MSNNNNESNKWGWITAGLCILSLVVIGSIVFGSGEPRKTDGATNTSNLEAAETFWDFGTISMANGKVSKIFAVKNSTSELVVVSKLYTSCMCTQATLYADGRKAGPFGMPAHGGVPTISESIPAGTEATVEAVFDPAAHGPAGVGPIDRNVFVETEGGAKLTLNFKAQVTP